MLLRFALRRVGMIVLVMLAVTFFTTLLVNLIPGSPAFAVYGDVPLEFANRWDESHGLNDPVWLQYWHWLSQALQGNLGGSWANEGGASVGELIAGRVPVTAEIAIVSLVASLFVAIVLAMIAANRPDGVVDRLVTFVASVAHATPPFVSAVFLLLIFAVSLTWLPALGYVPIEDGLGENLRSITLPVVALVLHLAPTLLRVLRGDLVSLLNEDFVNAARSRGLPEWYVMTRHVLRPASASLITVAGISFGNLLGGSIIVEIFFGVPGLGNLVYRAVQLKDIPVLTGAVVCVALFFAVVNTAVDLSYRVLDPRVRSVL